MDLGNSVKHDYRRKGGHLGWVAILFFWTIYSWILIFVSFLLYNVGYSLSPGPPFMHGPISNGGPLSRQQFCHQRGLQWINESLVCWKRRVRENYQPCSKYHLHHCHKRWTIYHHRVRGHVFKDLGDTDRQTNTGMSIKTNWARGIYLDDNLHQCRRQAEVESKGFPHSL